MLWEHEFFRVYKSWIHIYLQGYIPEYTEEGIDGNTLSIYVNDTLVDTLELLENESFTYQKEIAEYIGDGATKVEIKGAYSFIPSVLGTFADDRELSYLISSIGMDSENKDNDTEVDDPKDIQALDLSTPLNFAIGVDIEEQKKIKGLYPVNTVGESRWCSKNTVFYLDNSVENLP